MIGKIFTLPSFDKNRVNNHEENSKYMLKHHVTGSMIKVKNTNCDFRIINKELSLCREVKENRALVTVAEIQLNHPLNERLGAVGMAVTAVNNLVEDGKAKEKAAEICNKNNRNTAVLFNIDPCITKRGVEYVSQFIDNETPLDTTNYATALRIGGSMKNNFLDKVMVDTFNSTWNMRLNLTSKN